MSKEWSQPRRFVILELSDGSKAKARVVQDIKGEEIIGVVFMGEEAYGCLSWINRKRIVREAKEMKTKFYVTGNISIY